MTLGTGRIAVTNCSSTYEQMGEEDKMRIWLHLHLTNGVGPTIFRQLLETFGSPSAALRADRSALASVKGIGSVKADTIVSSRAQVDVDKELNLVSKAGVILLSWQSASYPVGLKNIYDPPPILYVSGQLEPEDATAIAIVGTRRPSRYGLEQAERFGAALGRAGFTVVSGLARGIDSAAHQGALKAGGRTIAVQGCGLGRVFPPENAELCRAIAKNGAVISEFPMLAEPLAENFPKRNRIISGLSLAVLVIEGPLRSGAMITARTAMEQGREVFALPGRVDNAASRGTNQLIKDGACLVTSLEDILDELGELGQQMRAGTEQADEPPAVPALPSNLSQAERAILSAAADEPMTVDEFCAAAALSAGEVSASLTMLQLKGLVRPIAGARFLRVKR